MSVVNRVRKIRKLRAKVEASTQRKQVRKDAQRELVGLVTQHLRWEVRTDKQRTA